MIELTSAAQLEEAKQWAYENLPKSVLIYLWLKLKLEHSMQENSTCYVDQFPNPNVIASVNYIGAYGLRSFPEFHMFTNLPLDKEDVVESFLIDFCNATGASSLGGIEGQAIDNDWCPVIMKAIGDRLKLNVSVGIWDNRMYYLPKSECDKLQNENIEAPENYEFDTLKLEEAEFVNSVWPHRIHGSDKLIQRRIRLLPTTCLREKGPEKRLASFELMHDIIGIMNHLYTVPEFRRRGLAMLVEKKQCQKMVQNGYIPVKTVICGNVDGEKITEACPWWEFVGNVSWVRFGDEKMAKRYEESTLSKCW